MPGVTTQPGARILEWFELESLRREANRATIGQEAFAIGRNQMRHRVTFPPMAVQPEATVHREDHPISAANELTVGGSDFGCHTRP